MLFSSKPIGASETNPKRTNPWGRDLYTDERERQCIGAYIMRESSEGLHITGDYIKPVCSDNNVGYSVHPFSLPSTIPDKVSQLIWTFLWKTLFCTWFIWDTWHLVHALPGTEGGRTTSLGNAQRTEPSTGSTNNLETTQNVLSSGRGALCPVFDTRRGERGWEWRWVGKGRRIGEWGVMGWRREV